MLKQDFSKRITIIVNKNLEEWQVLNTVAHISAYIGNKMKDKFDTGDYFETKNGCKLPRNSQFPIIVLSAKSRDLRKLILNIRNSNLLHIGFIREMIETTNDEEISKILSNKLENEIEYLGIGVFGENNQINILTKKLSLWK